MNAIWVCDGACGIPTQHGHLNPCGQQYSPPHVVAQGWALLRAPVRMPSKYARKLLVGERRGRALRRFHLVDRALGCKYARPQPKSPLTMLNPRTVTDAVWQD